ncbi:hypothetical protein LCGC14_0898110 [marine sediment metagenome]|uniref:Uncharacterized protein n=1 Tax=marine sediment metagenome TaxID=412755 RepID=A0A0F9PHZ7_9ZZZZ
MARRRTRKSAQIPDSAGKELLICDPRTACKPDLTAAICMIATKVSKVDLNHATTYVVGVGTRTRRQLVAELDVALQTANRQGYTVNYYGPTDSQDDLEL